MSKINTDSAKNGFIKETKKESGYKKAAEFLILVGKEQAAKILKHLSEEEIQGITEEIAETKSIDKDKAKKILDEFGYLLKTRDLVARGGLDKAKEMLTAAFGEEKGGAIYEKILQRTIPHPFVFLNDLDFDQVLNLLKNESSPVLSVILSHLEHGLAAKILSSLSIEMQKNIAKRIANMEKIVPEVLRSTEQSLLKKVREQGRLVTKEIDGKNALLNIIKHMNLSDEESLITGLSDKDPELAESIKINLFTIEIVLKIRDKDFQKILQEFEDKEIALILKGENDQIKDKFLSNVSSRRKEIIELEYKAYGEVLKKDKDEITLDFLNYLREENAKGELLIIREEDQFIM
jgi:flagellar motor switch protein FliG